MTSSEVIDTAIRIYQQLGWSFLKATVVPSLFIVAALAFIIDYVLPSFFTTKDASNLTTQFGEVAFAVGLAIVVGGPLNTAPRSISKSPPRSPRSPQE